MAKKSKKQTTKKSEKKPSNSKEFTYFGDSYFVYKGIMKYGDIEYALIFCDIRESDKCEKGLVSSGLEKISFHIPLKCLSNGKVDPNFNPNQEFYCFDNSLGYQVVYKTPESRRQSDLLRVVLGTRVIYDSNADS